MAVNLIICIAVPLEMLLLYTAALRLFAIIYPEKRRSGNRRRMKRKVKRNSFHADGISRFQKLL
jgi:hypothetical protein